MSGIVSTASEVVDAHGDLLTKVRPHGGIWDYVQANNPEHEMHESLKGLASVLVTADNYVVTADMVDLISYAAKSLTTKDLLDTGSLPSDAGFLRLDKPLTIDLGYVEDPLPAASWLVWGPVVLDGQRMTGIWWISDVRDERLPLRDGYERERLGHWSNLGFLAWTAQGEPYSVQDREVITNLEELYSVTEDYAAQSRFTIALFSMLGQTITDVSEMPVLKYARRDAERLSITHRTRFITLRRRSGVNRKDGESQVEWRVRWVVKGHWRNQRYGTNREQVRRIWIAPFVKGPEDAPLAAGEKVYRLSR